MSKKKQEFIGVPKKWIEVLKILDRPLNNAERRDRYNHTIHGEFGEGLNTNNSQNMFEVRQNHITSPEIIAIMTERSDVIYKALSELDNVDAKIVIGYYLYAETLKEIGQQLQISDVAVLKRKKKTLENSPAKIIVNKFVLIG